MFVFFNYLDKWFRVNRTNRYFQNLNTHEYPFIYLSDQKYFVGFVDDTLTYSIPRLFIFTLNALNPEAQIAVKTCFQHYVIG